jgi:cytochrome P450
MFNAGPRICLGKPLALMNMKLAMSILLTSNFQFEDKVGHSGEYLWTLVKSMKNGFEVNITKKDLQQSSQ